MVRLQKLVRRHVRRAGGGKTRKQNDTTKSKASTKNNARARSRPPHVAPRGGRLHREGRLGVEDRPSSKRKKRGRLRSPTALPTSGRWS